MHRYTSIITTVFLMIHPLLVLSSATSACYFPDGTLITNDSPCFPDQEDSMCCGHGHSCMSNGMCRWPDSAMPDPLVYIRGSCTDKSWKSDKCPPQCDNQYPSSFDPVIGCANGQYCCENDSFNPGSCCDKNDFFPLPAATTVTVIGLSTWSTSAVGVPTGVQTDPAGVFTSTSTATAGSASSPFHSSSSPAASGATGKTIVTSSVSTTATATATAITNTAIDSSTSHVTVEPSVAPSSASSQASPTLTSTSVAAFGVSISLFAAFLAFVVNLGFAFC